MAVEDSRTQFADRFLRNAEVQSLFKGNYLVVDEVPHVVHGTFEERRQHVEQSFSQEHRENVLLVFVVSVFDYKKLAFKQVDLPNEVEDLGNELYDVCRFDHKLGV